MQKAKIYQVAQTPTVQDIIESACGEGAKQVIQGDLEVGWFVFRKKDFWKKKFGVSLMLLFAFLRHLARLFLTQATIIWMILLARWIMDMYYDI